MKRNENIIFWNMKTRIDLKNRIEIFPYKRKVVSSKKFLELVNDHPEKIGNIKFLMPKLGTESLGEFVVEYEW